MIAKSFQTGYEIVGAPYEQNKKMYVVIRHNNTKKERTVRWYSEQEYKKLYPDAKIEVAAPAVNHNKILGFAKGYITIFAGVNDANEDWFRRHVECRYHDWWGWYVVSTEEVPADIPFGVRAIQLPWEEVGADAFTLKAKADVKRAIEAYLYEDDGSVFVGNVGDRIELRLTVERAIPLENNFGHSTMHIFTGEDNNKYIWTTAAKTLSEGGTYNIRGTIKEHRVYQGQHQNILTRCFII